MDIDDIKVLKEHMFDVISAMQVMRRDLGPGLNEYCYQEGLALQLTEQNIPFQKEMSFHPTYHGKTMFTSFRTDFICKGDIIVECKAIESIGREQRAQLYNYMRLLKMKCGILVNFYPEYYQLERYFYDEETHRILAVNGNTIKIMP